MADGDRPQPRGRKWTGRRIIAIGASLAAGSCALLWLAFRIVHEEGRRAGENTGTTTAWATALDSRLRSVDQDLGPLRGLPNTIRESEERLTTQIRALGKRLDSMQTDLSRLQGDSRFILQSTRSLSREMQSLVNPLDEKSLVSSVHRTGEAVQDLCRMAAELHKERDQARIVEKYCPVRVAGIAPPKLLYSPIQHPAYVEPSEVVKDALRFRVPAGTASAVSLPVYAWLAGEITSVRQEKDGRFTIAFTHGLWRSEYLNLANVREGLAAGVFVAGGEEVAKVLSGSDTCLRAKLVGPDGKPVDARAFLPPLPKPSEPVRR